MRCRHALAVIPFLFSLMLARAQDSDGYWSAGGSGSWANSGNWDSGIIADGTDNAAYFGINIEPPITSTNPIFTLDGARTIGYINLYGPSSAANWSLNTGAGGPLTLSTTFDVPTIYVTPASLQFTVNTVIAGTNGLEKQAAGALVLAATNLYTGGTTVTAGPLIVNGIITDTNTVTVNNSATLGGTGTILGPVTVFSGGILSPGNPLGTFSISNALTLQAGSKTMVNVNAATLAHDLVSGISLAAYGGTLTVSNFAGMPGAGQSFQIFSTAGASGDFSTITPQLSGGMRWQFNPASGVLSVVGTNLQPGFASVTLSAGTNLVLALTNGVPGATNYLLAATNLTLPRASWTRLATNIFDADGNLILSNAVSPNLPQRFYLLSAP